MITSERHVQLLLAILNSYGIKHYIVSPGSTNIPVGGSLDSDEVEVYSVVDERSAAYQAVGIAQLGIPVVLSCTGATASRNYLPAITEAFYRKLPILALTSFNGTSRTHNGIAQSIDRSVMPKDTYVKSIELSVIKDSEDEEYCKRLINDALLHLTKNGGGPVHINLETEYSGIFTNERLEKMQHVELVDTRENMPLIDNSKRILLYLGSHKSLSPKEIVVLEDFCSKFNVAIIGDHTSGYSGEYFVQSALVCQNRRDSALTADLLLYAGEVSGDYSTFPFLKRQKNCYRISPDGDLKDPFSNVTKVIQFGLIEFCQFYSAQSDIKCESEYLKMWKDTDKALRAILPELPFSNISIAREVMSKIDSKYILHFAILNSLRSWNFFSKQAQIKSFCNVGGFGIDGPISTVIGTSLIENNKINLLITGDLAFFYDLNALGLRHIPRNLKIILVNNGSGVEFKNKSHIASKINIDPNKTFAAGGHFLSGNESGIFDSDIRKATSVVRSYSSALGFSYYAASNLKDFRLMLVEFLNNDSKSILECFVNDFDDVNALETISTYAHTTKDQIKARLKGAVSNELIKKFKR